MIGAKGSGYQVQWAASDPRQKHVEWWTDNETHAFKADALSEARAMAKRGITRVRVVQVTHECVWASDAALVAVGEPVPPKRGRRTKVKRVS